MRTAFFALIFSAATVGLSFGQPPKDAGVEGLEWNKYDVNQRVHVLSLDDKQGRYLYANFSNVKKWSLERWGLPDVDVSSETRIFCVPTKDQMVKFFKIDRSAVEYRKDDKGQSYTIAWILCDDRPNRVLTSVITDLSLSEYERSAGVKLPWWTHRGMVRLNGTIGDIRSDLSAMQGPQIFGVQAVLEMAEADYKKLTPDRQVFFDRQAASLLLLCRKEYGQVRTLEFIHAGPAGVVGVLGFRTVEHFGATYTRYLADLSSGVAAGRTPDSYLDIKAVRRR